MRMGAVLSSDNGILGWGPTFNHNALHIQIYSSLGATFARNRGHIVAARSIELGPYADFF